MHDGGKMGVGASIGKRKNGPTGFCMGLVLLAALGLSACSGVGSVLSEPFAEDVEPTVARAPATPEPAIQAPETPPPAISALATPEPAIPASATSAEPDATVAAGEPVPVAPLNAAASPLTLNLEEPAAPVAPIREVAAVDAVVPLAVPAAPDEFLNLADVPQRPDDLPAPAERAAVQNELEADRADLQQQAIQVNRVLISEIVSGQPAPSPSTPQAVAAAAIDPTPPVAPTPLTAPTAPELALDLPAGGAPSPSLAPSVEVNPSVVVAADSRVVVNEPPGPTRNAREVFAERFLDSGRATLAPVATPGSQVASRPAPAAGGSLVLAPIGTPQAVVLFGDGRSGLSSQARATVQMFALSYGRRGGAVRVVGHASSDGASDPVRRQLANFGIAQERANAVAQALIRAGVPASVITVVSMTDRQSSGDPASDRRAEIFFE